MSRHELHEQFNNNNRFHLQHLKCLVNDYVVNPVLYTALIRTGNTARSYVLSGIGRQPHDLFSQRSM